MNNESLEDIIKRTGCLCTEIKGTSMNPLLRQGVNKVYVEAPKGRLKKMDVALYKRSGGDYILHRVINVCDDGYVMCGDNHYVLEYGVTDDNILGVMRGYYSGEKYVDVEKSFKYKFYVNTYARFFFIRKIVNLFRKAFNKLK